MSAAAVCAPGLEFVCRQELEALGCRPKPAGPGTVAFNPTLRQLYAANVWLRSAVRVVVRVGTFRATDFAHLQQRAGEIEWDRWLPAGYAPSFRVSSSDSKLYHTDAIAQRLHQVVGPPSTGEPEQLVIVRIDRNTVTMSIDASGAPLHHRPWRTELGEAPLRTTMAAGLLMACGWTGDVGLLDPFCGAGTIPIEAALAARGLPPGGDRPYAFQEWPTFDSGTWASVRGEIAARASASAPSIIAGADRDSAVIAMAEANAERAGVAGDIEFSTRVVSHTKALPAPGLVAANPPYGKRLGDGTLDGLYRRFGAVLRDRLPGWRLAMVCPDPKLAAAADRRLRRVARFRHGGLSVQVFERGAETDSEGPDLRGPDPGERAEPMDPLSARGGADPQPS